MKDDLTSASDDGALTALDWAGASGERWLANLDSLERMIEPIGTALLSHAGYRQGESVVDIGCGGGWTTRQIAGAVGPEGSVVGVDISPVLIQAARERARTEEIANIAFEVADAGSAMPAGAPFPMPLSPICAAWWRTEAGSTSPSGRRRARTRGSPR